MWFCFCCVYTFFFFVIQNEKDDFVYLAKSGPKHTTVLWYMCCHNRSRYLRLKYIRWEIYKNITLGIRFSFYRRNDRIDFNRKVLLTFQMQTQAPSYELMRGGNVTPVIWVNCGLWDFDFDNFDNRSLAMKAHFPSLQEILLEIVVLLLYSK